VNAILCVDSDPQALQSLSTIIRSNGYICISAGTAEDAVRALLASCVDLVILNQDAEKFALAAKLKRFRSVPTILITDKPDREQKPSGVDVLSPKPIRVRELLATISALLTSSLRLRRLHRVA
jgi:DNA-binding response OmpR family regulator